MLYYFPYVKDVTNPNCFIRLGWFLEEAKAEHTVRMYMSKQRKLTNMTKFNTQPDKITFYINGGTLVGYIKKETVKVCLIKPLNSLTCQNKYGTCSGTSLQ